MSTDQYTFTDPRTLYPAISPPIQQQEEPGIQARMEPIPDLGEHTVELVDYRAAEHSSPAVIRESVALWRSPSPARGPMWPSATCRRRRETRRGHCRHVAPVMLRHRHISRVLEWLP